MGHWMKAISAFVVIGIAAGVSFCTAQSVKRRTHDNERQPTSGTAVVRPFNPAAYHREQEYSRLVGLGNRFLKNDPRAAASYFQQALPLSAVPDEATTGLGKAMEKQGKSGEALAAYRRAFGPTTHSYSNYPADVEALARYGLLSERAGDWDEALKAYEQARERLNPKPILPLDVEFDPKVPQPDQLRAMLHVVRGLTLEEQGKGNEALAAYSEAAHLQPNQPLAQFYLGRGLRRTGRAAEAQTAFQKAARLGTGAVQAEARKALR